MRGLVNLGNSCYFNASLQVLLHVPILSNRFIKSTYQGKCEFTRLYSALVNDFWKASDQPRKPINPVSLVRAFQREFPRFVDDEQHDVQEAVMCIIDILERADPWIKQIVYGKKVQETKWPGGTSSREEPFCVHILSCHARGATDDIEEMLEKATEWVPVEGFVDKDGTRHHVAATRTFFKTTPKVLFVSFDRKSHVRVPERLAVTRTGDSYKLVASAVHVGVQHGGHYGAFTLHKSKWRFRDDELDSDIHHLMNPAGHYFLAYVKMPPPA